MQDSKANTFYRVEGCYGRCLAGEASPGIGARIAPTDLPSSPDGPSSGGKAVMSAGFKLTGLLLIGVLCLPVVGRADTPKTHPIHKAKKQAAPPVPLPSGPRGPVPQVPLDAIPAVAPQVTYQDGQLTIVAPNSTLGDVLRSVRKYTSADIDIPATANERVVTRLGPGPAREVMAELLNGSHFNYILLGSSEDANELVRVVLVPKTGPDTPGSDAVAKDATPQAANAVDTTDPLEDTAEDTPEQGPVEAEQPTAAPEQQGIKTPQQLLQEMQQRQLQLQQGRPGGFAPAPGAAVPQPQPPDQQ